MTRRQQWCKRQNIYRIRRKKMYDRGWKFKTVMLMTPFPHMARVHDGRKTPLWNGDKQKPLDLAQGSLHGPYPILPLPFGVTYVNTFDGPHKTPHARSTGPWRGALVALEPTHLQTMYWGFQRKRLKWVGRKPDRMNGFQRSCRGAAWRAYSEGYFPDWDPLHRHPTIADIEAGAGFYAGPFPQTPR